MNYNINIDEISDDKIIIPKKNYYCTNCNRKGHTFKTCKEATISNGIIAIYIKNLDHKIIPSLENYISKNLKIFANTNNKKSSSSQYEKYISNRENINNTNTNSNEIMANSQNQNSLNKSNSSLVNKPNKNLDIKFLMVQRKKSLGYLEFMRGRYNTDNSTSLIRLLEQMTPEELADINNNDFDELWNDLWDNANIKNKNHHKEYVVSKQKFYQLKLSHSDILLKTKPLFEFNEWGFPKGRREPYESDLVCAIREFEEETIFGENDYTVLEKCKSIRENLIGTNGIDYAHNYYLSILFGETSLNSNKQNNVLFNREIGQIKLLDLSECLEKIRPYHKNKIRIVKGIYSIINDFYNEYE